MQPFLSLAISRWFCLTRREGTRQQRSLETPWWPSWGGRWTGVWWSTQPSSRAWGSSLTSRWLAYHRYILLFQFWKQLKLQIYIWIGLVKTPTWRFWPVLDYGWQLTFFTNLWQHFLWTKYFSIYLRSRSRCVQSFTNLARYMNVLYSTEQNGRPTALKVE